MREELIGGCTPWIIPAGTIKSYLFRGRKMLKEKLLTNYSREYVKDEI